MPQKHSRQIDPAARFLELGLCLTVILAPLPFGAVGPGGRAMLELCALTLGLVWLGRAMLFPTPLPPRLVRIGLVGLLLLGALQAIPLGATLVEFVSPASMELRRETSLSPEAKQAEERLLGRRSSSLDATPSISVDPSATASAVRTGAACIVLLLVALVVAATAGVRRLAQALLVSASFQGLYGLLVLTSGHDMIWNRPKLFYTDSATGTFINKNHFACFLAMTLACGVAMILAETRRTRRGSGARNLFVALLGNEGSRVLVWGLLIVIGLAGLLASLSRAGIAVGLISIVITFMVTRRRGGLRTRAILVAVLLIASAVPMAQIGADRLVERFSQSAFDLTKAGSRTTVWGDTLSMTRSFPVAGAGFGTFAAAYPVFRSPEVRLFYAHAHNDLLQLAAEGGIVGAVLLLLVLVPIVGLIVACLTMRKGTLAVGFAAGLLAMLLHALVDFNFHIPANAAIASVLAGAIMGLPWKSRN